MPANSITARQLTDAAFEPFGDVLRLPADGRADFARALATTRPHAWPTVACMTKLPSLERPYAASYLERHRYSSQTFFPVTPGDWLVIVAPALKTGDPDADRALAFRCRADEGVTFKAGIWHHGLTVIETKQSFLMTMWMDGSDGDGEVLKLAAPIEVRL